jgi:DNA-binding transcriptional MocR family regulator
LRSRFDVTDVVHHRGQPAPPLGARSISLDTLSQRAGIAKNTVKRYLEYLEAAFLVKRVQRVGQDGRQFQRAHHFKAYLTNPSLRAALFLPIDADMGAMVETAIFGQWFTASTTICTMRAGRVARSISSIV